MNSTISDAGFGSRNYDFAECVMHAVETNEGAATLTHRETVIEAGPQEKRDFEVDYINTESINTDAGRKQLTLCGKRPVSQWALLGIASLMVLVGGCAATVMGRLYFVHGGSRRWLYTWLQTAGWPLNLIPLSICSAYNKTSCWSRAGDGRSSICGHAAGTLKLLISIYVAMGFLVTADNLIFAWGLSFLPASTTALLLSSQLAFNAVFSYLLVGQRMTPSVLNSLFAIILAAVLLGLHGNSDRPPGTTHTQYIVGFILAIVAAALCALIFTLLEVIYKRVLKRTNYAVAVEVQTLIAIAATVMATVGMWVAGDFHALRKECESFGLGKAGYVLTLMGSAAAWQVLVLSSTAVVLVGSSLFNCVLITAGLPITSFFSFLVFGDSFSALKAISMLVSMWGFISYIHGGYSSSLATHAQTSPPHIVATRL